MSRMFVRLVLSYPSNVVVVFLSNSIDNVLVAVSAVRGCPPSGCWPVLTGLSRTSLKSQLCIKKYTANWKKIYKVLSLVNMFNFRTFSFSQNSVKYGYWRIWSKNYFKERKIQEITPQAQETQSWSKTKNWLSYSKNVTVIPTKKKCFYFCVSLSRF